MVDKVDLSEEKEEVIDLLDIVEPQEEAPDRTSPDVFSQGEDMSCRNPVAEPVETSSEPSDSQSGMCSQEETEKKDSEERNEIANDRESILSEMSFVPQGTKQEDVPVNVGSGSDIVPDGSGTGMDLDDSRILEVAGALQKNAQELSTGASESAQDEEDFEAFRNRCTRMLHEMEERLLAAEKARDELSARVEDLQQQLVDAGAMLLEDSGVRLQLEELVSRMLDVRGSQPDVENSSLLERMDALEKRISGWEERADQKMMSAAARVIREEIAAMRADADSSDHA